MSGRHRPPRPEGWTGRWAFTANISVTVGAFLLLGAMATLTGDVEQAPNQATTAQTPTVVVSTSAPQPYEQLQLWERRTR